MGSERPHVGDVADFFMSFDCMFGKHVALVTEDVECCASDPADARHDSLEEGKTCWQDARDRLEDGCNEHSTENAASACTLGVLLEDEGNKKQCLSYWERKAAVYGVSRRDQHFVGVAGPLGTAGRACASIHNDGR